MVTTRRANGISKPSSKAAASSSPTSMRRAAAIPPPTHSPFLPTHTECLLLLLYPLTLLFGSLFSHFSPSLRPPFNTSTYSTLHQSFQPASEAPSYFAQKRNVFNVYFVKLGWFWCTLAFFSFLLFAGRGRRTPATPAARSTDAYSVTRQEGNDRVRRRYQAVFRYTLCTVSWFLTTQWCFGPPLVDRGFAWTGGACEYIAKELENADQESGAIKAADALTHAACKSIGGAWIGGYDISGHVFLLVLGSGMLFHEILPFILTNVKGTGVGRVLTTSEGQNVRVANEIDAAELYLEDDSKREKEEAVVWTLRAYATTMALGVAVLSCWMLLMTAAFFHTWFEKLTGWLLAFATLWLTYYLPRGVPAIRAALGMPGV